MKHDTFEQLMERFKETSGGQRAIGLLGRHKIALKDMMAAVLSEVNERVPVLFHGALYSTEQLCGEELWEAVRYVGPRRAAGMILVFIVETGVVPLDIHQTKSGKGPKRFVLSPHWKQGQSVNR